MICVPAAIAPASDAAPASAAAEADDLDAAVRGMAWRLRLLEETAEIAMEVQRAMRDDIVAEQRFHEGTLRNPDGDKLEPAVLAAIAAQPKRRDPAATLDRAARALRLTLALHARTEQSLRALRAGVAAERAARAEGQARADREAQVVAQASEDARREARVEKIRDIVLEAADREVLDIDAAGDLELALDERLECDPAYAGGDDLPLEETVRRLCADLDLAPDWSRWSGEGWSAPEPFSRPRTSWFAAPSRTASPAFAAFHTAWSESRRRLLE